jgi:hypothetical protein
VCEAAADPDIYDDVQQAISDVSKALNLAGMPFAIGRERTGSAAIGGYRE